MLTHLIQIGCMIKKIEYLLLQTLIFKKYVYNHWFRNQLVQVQLLFLGEWRAYPNPLKISIAIHKCNDKWYKPAKSSTPTHLHIIDRPIWIDGGPAPARLEQFQAEDLFIVVVHCKYQPQPHTLFPGLSCRTPLTICIRFRPTATFTVQCYSIKVDRVTKLKQIPVSQ